MSKQLFTKEFEDYLITGSEESINSLPCGSLEKEYFFILKELQKEKLTPELEIKIESFLKKIPEEQSYRLKALHIYQKLKQNKATKEEIIKEIKNLFHIKEITKYSMPTKYNITSEGEKEEKEIQKYPSELKLEKYVFVDIFIEGIYKGTIIPNNEQYEKFFENNELNLKLDFNKVPKNILIKIFTGEKEFSKIFPSLIDSFKITNISYFKDVIKSIIDISEKDEKKKEYFKKIIENNKSKLLSEQIEYILSFQSLLNFENLIVELIMRKYPVDIEDKLKKLEILNGILDILYKCNFEYDIISTYILYPILTINTEMNIFEFDTFIKYIKNPLLKDTSRYNISAKIEDKIKNDINQKREELFREIKQLISYYEYDERRMIEKHLEHFFLKKKIDYNKLNKYFNESYIKNFYSKIKFYSGDEQIVKNNILSDKKINDLMNEIKLTIDEGNKEEFSINDDIELTLELKNIQSLYVNIYEINTENYYNENKASFDNIISLDGLIPTFTEQFYFNEKPQLLFHKKIKLEKIPKKRGLFVIEFIGNNNHISRAIIQKGFLKYIHKNTINGKVFYILDEDNKILKGNKTGIYINNIWYQSIEDTGAILIPYSIKGDIIIFKHEDFCCIETHIKIPDESYKFNAQFILNQESFIIGNKTKILVRPYLFICDELCSLEYLKNVKLTINTITAENFQIIPSISVVDNIKLSYDKEYCFDFQVPFNLKSAEFIISGDIEYKSIQRKENLSFTQEYNFIKAGEINFLLKKNDIGNYILNIVGRNGEAKPYHQINFKLKHKIQKNLNNNRNILLSSNKDGKIDLSKLTDITQCSQDSIVFPLLALPKHSYIKQIIILENEKIDIPFITQEKNIISLIKKSNEKIDKNCSELIHIEITDKIHHLGKIIIPKLSEGLYELNINDIYFSIYVVKGKVKEKTKFIFLDNGNIIYKNFETPISIEQISYENNILRIKLNKNCKNINHPRVHINCVQYLYPFRNKNLIKFINGKFYNYIKDNIKKQFLFFRDKNLYLDGKILSDELQYVLDRKQYKSYLGNSLENPSLLLKPQLIKDSTTEIQSGEVGKNYHDSKLFHEDYDRCSDCCYRYKIDDDDEKNDNIIITRDYINVFPYIEENLIPDENGEIIIKNLNLSEYSFLHIICFDKISCYEDWFFLQDGKTSLRDLRAKNEFDLNKNYCEFRKIYHLSEKNKFHIDDARGVKFKIFDSLEKLVEFFNLVNPKLIKEIKNFEFLLNFEELKLAEKLEKIGQYFSHELNIFLYFHHNDFFNKYIFPIIKYKSEKTFIDYFLLNDTEKIKKEYLYPQKIHQLNIFEKCLLIYLIRKENKKLSISLSRQIRAECPKENQNELKRLFNIAINLKSSEEQNIEEEIKLNFKIENIEDIEELKKRIEQKKNFAKKLGADNHRRREKKLTFEEELLNELNFKIKEDKAKLINIKAHIFKNEGKSKEFCETHYYNSIYKNNDNSNLIKPSHFFADLAQFWSENDDAIRNIGFKSENILLKPKNSTELIFILSILDLNPKTNQDNINYLKEKDLGLIIETNSNAYLLIKEINETKLNMDNKYSLILAQIFFEEDKNDKNNQKECDKFLINKIYIQKTVVSNISSENITCEVLMHIPEGSIPIEPNEYKIIETADIDGYSSKIFEQKFYFPQIGIFNQYPASASINDLVIAKSGLKTFEVLSNIKLDKNCIDNIDDVLEISDKNEIIEFFGKKDIIQEKDLQKIYWMLKDKDFYNRLINILKSKYIYNNNIWEYSSENGDINSLKEYIIANMHKNKNIFKSLGHEYDLLFVELNKTNNAHILNHLDYFPIIKQRLFELPKSKSILIKELRDTYQNYISYLITLEKINDYEYMRLCYYLILQQRIKEANIIYNKINKNNIIGNGKSSFELQYDYLTAYLDFSFGFPKFEQARQICKKYKNISISYWKYMFDEIEEQLLEYDTRINLNEEKNELMNKNIYKNKDFVDEFLNFEIKGKKINIIYKNISEIKIKYYLIDIEILFSISPFGKKSEIDFDLIQPQKIDTIKLEKQFHENKYILDIPHELINKNCYIEISYDKIKLNDIYFSSLLKYSLIESIGEIKIMTSELKPLPKVYVKCYCKMNNGKIIIYKDGFTDLRGKFDYLSLNNDIINDVKKFGMLIISKEYGSIIVYCYPPRKFNETKEN